MLKNTVKFSLPIILIILVSLFAIGTASPSPSDGPSAFGSPSASPFYETPAQSSAQPNAVQNLPQASASPIEGSSGQDNTVTSGASPSPEPEGQADIPSPSPSPEQPPQSPSASPISFPSQIPLPSQAPAPANNPPAAQASQSPSASPIPPVNAPVNSGGSAPQVSQSSSASPSGSPSKNAASNGATSSANISASQAQASVLASISNFSSAPKAQAEVCGDRICTAGESAVSCSFDCATIANVSEGPVSIDSWISGIISEITMAAQSASGAGLLVLSGTGAQQAGNERNGSVGLSSLKPSGSKSAYSDNMQIADYTREESRNVSCTDTEKGIYSKTKGSVTVADTFNGKPWSETFTDECVTPTKVWGQI